MSKDEFPEVPNGFEMIPIDINEADLRAELFKLRNKAKANKKAGKEEEKKDDGTKKGAVAGKDTQGKDAKKGGKDDKQ